MGSVFRTGITKGIGTGRIGSVLAFATRTGLRGELDARPACSSVDDDVDLATWLTAAGRRELERVAGMVDGASEERDGLTRYKTRLKCESCFR